MMTFDATPAPVTVRFQPGHKYHGAEARLRGMSIGEYMQATGMDGGEGEDTAKTMERFFKSLVSWNLTIDGQPLPPTPEAMQLADQKLIRALNNQYVTSLMGVPDSDPLPESSTSGEPSPAPAIPMAPLSENQAS
ncbi:hypothetical protein [Streptomyces flaveolus]|uniref:hypothetical protein n=1 Tax=Streptomyces flaveolus TaxID=67297 RepID=UPI00167152BD|nr:hypothetical protein [Streptomyces flaveolus]GGQ83845.1 hypothetical protein GCM10010216_52170 [Streptomyces flaveolus]